MSAWHGPHSMPQRCSTRTRTRRRSTAPRLHTTECFRRRAHHSRCMMPQVGACPLFAAVKVFCDVVCVCVAFEYTDTITFETGLHRAQRLLCALVHTFHAPRPQQIYMRRSPPGAVIHVWVQHHHLCLWPDWQWQDPHHAGHHGRCQQGHL